MLNADLQPKVGPALFENYRSAEALGSPGRSAKRLRRRPRQPGKKIEGGSHIAWRGTAVVGYRGGTGLKYGNRNAGG